MINLGKGHDAKSVILDGMKKFPSKKKYFIELGHKIVESSGDRDFRKQIEKELVKRN